jgi:hypothetical protein
MSICLANMSIHIPISISTRIFSSTREDIKEILKEHVANVMNETDVTRNLINVRRSNVLVDGLTKMSRASFVPSRKLSVKFADDVGQSEGAVDLGGPTREFLRLSVRELFESSMFAGEPGSRVLVPNVKGIKDSHCVIYSVLYSKVYFLHCYKFCRQSGYKVKY